METSVDLEKLRIQELAQEYRDKGYEVTIQPRRSQLPEFLARYRPDILAYGEDENLIVEVESRTSMMRSRDLRKLARTIEEHPGWRFELVVTNPSEDAPYVENAPSLDKNGIAKATEKIDELLDSNHLEAALLLAWATVEAALRLLAEREEIPLQRRDAPYLLKQLAVFAVISADEYNYLMRIMRLRNAVAHGFEANGLDSKTVNHKAEVFSETLKRNPVARGSDGALETALAGSHRVTHFSG